MTVTPSLPPEQLPVGLEEVFISEQPGHWPKNQNSYLGALRVALLSYVQTASDQLDEMFIELFGQTTDQWIAKHEKDYGIPQDTTGLTLEQRRGRLLLRYRRGAFTRTNREFIV